MLLIKSEVIFFILDSDNCSIFCSRRVVQQCCRSLIREKNVGAGNVTQTSAHAPSNTWRHISDCDKKLKKTF